MRHPVNKAAFKAPWSPTRHTPDMWDAQHFSLTAQRGRTDAFPAVTSPHQLTRGGAPYGGYTATEAWQRVF